MNRSLDVPESEDSGEEVWVWPKAAAARSAKNVERMRVVTSSTLSWLGEFRWQEADIMPAIFLHSAGAFCVMPSKSDAKMPHARSCYGPYSRSRHSGHGGGEPNRPPGGSRHGSPGTDIRHA